MPVLVYSLLRILLIVAAGGGLYLAGMRGLLLMVGAVLIGAGLSYVLLDRFRRASADWLASRGRGKTRWEDRLAAEADDEDALLEEDLSAAERLAADADAADADPADERGPADRHDPGGSDQQRDQKPQADD